MRIGVRGGGSEGIFRVYSGSMMWVILVFVYYGFGKGKLKFKRRRSWFSIFKGSSRRLVFVFRFFVFNLGFLLRSLRFEGWVEVWFKKETF